MLNQIDLTKVYSQLSPKHVAEINHLLTNLRLQPSQEARIAPSLITRGEIQIFGCSTPRFALRIYFRNSPGFLNIRRLRPLETILQRRKASTEPPQSSLHTLSHEEIVQILQDERQSCIADCLLPHPQDISLDDYHILKVRLSDAYGETLSGFNAHYSSTPFVKNVSLGGGLCAQACCFMSTALLHDHALGVHGLADITALANSPRHRILSISDMNYPAMSRYFAAVSLAMTQQCTHAQCFDGPIHGLKADTLEFESAIKSYLLSGIPVVLPVDTGRMLGFKSLDSAEPRQESDSIYKQNGLTIDVTKFDRTKPDRHCVVIVGVSKYSEPGHTKFLFNDPSYFPFMDATVTELMDAGPYLGNTGQIDRTTFFSITPAAVKMPLLDYKPLGSLEYRAGLRRLSKTFRQTQMASPLRYPAEQTTHFILTQIKDFSSLRYLDPLTHKTDHIPKAWASIRDQLVLLGQKLQATVHWQDHRWLWLEIMKDAIWVWDAEVEPIMYDEQAGMHEYLVAKLAINGNQIATIWPEEFEITD